MNKRKKIYLIILFTFLILISSYVLFNIFSYYSSFSQDENAWDGKSISTSFASGNGSKDNPYLISNGSDFMYFKSLIEEDDEYSSLYYKLDNNINMGSNKITGIGTKDKYFKGHFDGNGYTISNISIDRTTIEDGEYYSLFNYTENSYIYNLNLDNVIIDVLSNGNNNVIVGGLVGKINTKSSEDDKVLSSINDISLSNVRINLSSTINNENNCIGVLSCSIDKNVNIKNLYLGGNIITNYNDNISVVAKNTLSDSSNIINSISSLYDNYINTNNTKHNNMIIARENGSYILNDKTINIDDILNTLNKDNNYVWEYDEIFKLKEPVKAASIVPNKKINKVFAFSINGTINLHDSDISGNTLYVNDLDADLNYYNGLNYTDYRDIHTLPTGNSRNLYSTSRNLVKVYIRYSGVDYNDDSLVGNVSLTEQIDTIIYYKYYVVENGYVTIDLIDNPWADRPNNKVFNGWVTDYDGAKVTVDMDTYVRQVKIPVSNVSDTININFMSSWIDGNIQFVSNGLTNAMSNFYNKGFHGITSITLSDNIDITDYYTRHTINNNEYFPTGALNNNGNNVGGTRCRTYGWSSTCTYYLSATQYVSGTTYYSWNNYYGFQNVNLSQYEVEVNAVNAGDPVGGLYKRVHINNNATYSNLYNSSLDLVSGTCRTSGGCNFYEYQTYEDGNGDVRVADGNTIYYYMVTRDTNILVADDYITSDIENTKPMTITSINNGTNHNSRIYLYGSYNNYISAGDDLRIEYITLYTTSNSSSGDTITSSGSASGYIYGNYNNLKLGRGIRNNGNYIGSLGVIAGNSSATGSSGNASRYTFIVESGFYNKLSLTGGSYGRTVYVDGYGTYGNDYDRIDENNDNLEIYFAASGSWGDNVHSNDDNVVGLHTTVKSGSFGTSKEDYSTGIYIGGRGGGTSYCPRECVIEGGYIYNLIGGPLTASSRSNINDSYINIKGGSIDVVVGGAGASTTYGNRIINMTGGTVNYAVFGGSNGITGSDTGNYQGVLTGDTFVHIGGKAHVGGGTGSITSVYVGEAGSVFGAGNGNSRSTKVGTVSNSNILITGGTIDSNVYGGGNYGAIGTDLSNGSTVNTKIKVIGGTISGNVYGGGNNNGAGAYTRTSSNSNTYKTINGNVSIDVTGGIINNVYGGSRTSGKIYGDTTVNITGGTISTDVYGGGEGNNTFVRDSVNVTIGSNSTTPRINGSVYGGSAYGTVNITNSTNTTTCPTRTNQNVGVTVNSGTIVGSVYGGAKGSNVYTPKVCGDVTVTVNNGNIGSVYGGNNVSGSPNQDDYVYLKGGTIGDAFGGGNSTGQNETNIYLEGATVRNLYGGSNSSGNVTTTHVTVSSGTSNNIYGGNNLGGEVSLTNVIVSGGTVSGDIYGGGNQADSGDTNVSINATVHDVYGGGAQADCDSTSINMSGGTAHYIFGGSNTSGTVTSSEVSINNGTATRVYGGNNAGGNTVTSNVNISGGTVTDTFGGGDVASTTTSNVIITGGTSTNVYGGGNNAGVTTTNINMTGGSVTSMYGGSNASGDVNTTNITLGTSTGSSNLTLVDLYGGNNLGGTTGNTNVTAYSGTITNIYGGGNQAVVTGNTNLDLNACTLNSNVYGGGNEGAVSGNTLVHITGSTIAGSAYAGGNGSSATVSGNTTITIDGNTTIGTSGGAVPDTGSVFGGGNAAATGTNENNNSLATVNIVGGTIYGNVYGGANTSVIYGSTDVNIGTSAVSENGLVESDLVIHGTVFGGGEANASGSDVYDWTFISVTDSINIDINGGNYSTNNHDFKLNGSIFGSGNASTSTNPGQIYIKNLGTMSDVSKNISIQRAGLVTIDNSVIELAGIKDSTNDYSDIPYTFNQIDKLIIKNNTTLLLHKNANLLKELYSGVDVNGSLVKAKVDIDDDTKTVTKNVDNRIYMIPNNDLNIATNPAATSYGKVTGMTFFGMFNSYTSGNNGYGIYNPEFNYGDSITASELLIGGSYVLGLHSANMDITKDGFYTNVFNDGYTEVITEYIDPSEVGTTGYRWIIGTNTINYSFSLTASKYSTLGTYTLNMMDFAQGNTEFDVIGFNSEGLDNGVNLINGDNVPRLAATDEAANKTLGLSMKSETQEWTSYNETKYYSNADPNYNGDKNYKTDNVSTSPKLMFYLYHSKNISSNAELGTVVITMQAAVPRNEIEYDISIVTITIDLYSKVYEYDDAYDASITYGKKYDMPSATDVNVTNKSQFTSYFSIITKPKNFETFYGENGDNYHVLTSTYNYPVGTQFTMIDTAAGDDVEYYYYTVDNAKYNAAATELANEGEISYYLRDFIRMDSISNNNTYNDTVQNQKYFDSTSGYVYEEFLFIVDMKKTNTNTNELNKSLLFELRDADNDSTTQTVLGIRQDLMKFSLYDGNNSVLDLQASMNDQYLYANTSKAIPFTTGVNYQQTENLNSVIDTNYESDAMGLNISLSDNSGNQISSSNLLGTSIRLDGVDYFVDSDGVFRIKLSNKVSNLSKTLYLTSDGSLSPGNYTLNISLFSSSDGLHMSTITGSDTMTFPITIVGNDNALIVSCDDKDKVVIDGKNQLENTYNIYNITLKNVLTNPNIRLSVYKRDINTYDSTTYTEVNTNGLFNYSFPNYSSGLSAQTTYEKLLSISTNETQNFNLPFASNLTTGTYKLVFKLYDNNHLIEEDIEYVIVKKSD